MNDIIFVSLEAWDSVWRRNQFLCAEFSKRDPKRKILFVSPPRDLSNMLRSGKVSDCMGRATWTVPEFPNISVTRPTKLAPTSFSAGKALNEMLAKAHVRRIALRLNLANPILWINAHSAVHMVGHLNESALIYDITDDWTEFDDQSAQARKLVVTQDAALCETADAVLVCSERLRELKNHVSSKLHLIPNGVDAEHYQRGLDESSPPSPFVAKWPRPVLGYTGSIHSKRVDIDLLHAVARRFQGGTIVLVGPIMLSRHDQERLTACGNVHLTGPIPYSDLPRVMRAFDVCITPHVVSSFTESLNPIKLWEYLAVGKPIVSTLVAGFREFPELIYGAADADSFLTAVETALKEGVEKRDLRRSAAQAHSWRARASKVEEIMTSIIE